MRVVLSQTKNGFFSALAFSMKRNEAAMNSPSTVSMRLRVNGPVSLQSCAPQAPKRGSAGVSGLLSLRAVQCITPRGPLRCLKAGSVG